MLESLQLVDGNTDAVKPSVQSVGVEGGVHPEGRLAPVQDGPAIIITEQLISPIYDNTGGSCAKRLQTTNNVLLQTNAASNAQLEERLGSKQTMQVVLLHP